MKKSRRKRWPPYTGAVLVCVWGEENEVFMHHTLHTLHHFTKWNCPTILFVCFSILHAQHMQIWCAMKNFCTCNWIIGLGCDGLSSMLKLNHFLRMLRKDTNKLCFDTDDDRNKTTKECDVWKKTLDSRKRNDNIHCPVPTTTDGSSKVCAYCVVATADCHHKRRLGGRELFFRRVMVARAI
jgi:hypothetical protein